MVRLTFKIDVGKANMVKLMELADILKETVSIQLDIPDEQVAFTYDVSGAEISMEGAKVVPVK